MSGLWRSINAAGRPVLAAPPPLLPGIRFSANGQHPGILSGSSTESCSMTGTKGAQSSSLYEVGSLNVPTNSSVMLVEKAAPWLFPLMPTYKTRYLEGERPTSGEHSNSYCRNLLHVLSTQKIYIIGLDFGGDPSYLVGTSTIPPIAMEPDRGRPGRQFSC